MRRLIFSVVVLLVFASSADANVGRVGYENARYGNILVSGTGRAGGWDEFTVFDLRTGARSYWGSSCAGVRGARWMSLLFSPPYSVDGRHVLLDVQMVDGRAPGDSRLCAALLRSGRAAERGIAARVSVDAFSSRVRVVEEFSHTEVALAPPLLKDVPRGFEVFPPMVNGLYWNFDARTQRVRLARGKTIVSSRRIGGVRVRVRPLGQYADGCRPPSVLFTSRVRQAVPFGRTVWAISGKQVPYRCSGPIPHQFQGMMKAGEVVQANVSPWLLRSDDGGRSFRAVAQLPKSLEFGAILSADARGPVFSADDVFTMAKRLVRFERGRFV